LTETKRNETIQNEIKPILMKQFLGERQDKNLMKKLEKKPYKNNNLKIDLQKHSYFGNKF